MNVPGKLEIFFSPLVFIGTELILSNVNLNGKNESLTVAANPLYQMIRTLEMLNQCGKTTCGVQVFLICAFTGF